MAERKSLLQEIVETEGRQGLNQKYVDYALSPENGGGFGADYGGIRYDTTDNSKAYLTHDYSNVSQQLQQKQQAYAERVKATQAQNDWESKGTGRRVLDVLKDVVKGTKANILSNIAGFEAAVAGEGTIPNDTYALIRSILDREDGVSALEALSKYGYLTTGRLGTVLPNQLEKLWNDVGVLGSKVGLDIDTENDIFSRWSNYLNEKKAIWEKDFYDKVGEVNNIYTANQKYYQQKAQEQNTEAQYKYADAPVARNVYKYGTMVGTQLPNIAISIAMAFAGNPAAAGATIAGGMAQASTQGLQWYSALSQSSKLTQLGMMAAKSAGAIASDPQYWASVTMETGSAYNEAIAAGVDPSLASAYAISYGLMSGVVEVGGSDESAINIERLPKKIREALQNGETAKAAWEYAKSIIGEVGEEEWQEILQKIMDGAVLGQDVPLYSATDENAIINPGRMLETAKDTAITTALMGAGERAIMGGIQKVSDSREYRGDSEALIQAAKQVAPEQEAIRIAELEKDIADSGTKLRNGEARDLYRIIEQNGGSDAYVRGIMSAEAQERAVLEREKARRGERSAYAGLLPVNVPEGVRADTAGATVQTDRGAERVSFVREDGKNVFKLTAEDGSERTVTGNELKELGVGNGVIELVAALSALGENAPAAYSVYDGSMDVDQYASAMHQAVELYAGNGVDVRKEAQKVRDSGGYSLIGQLSDVQLEMAQALGTKIYQQKQAAVQEKSTKLLEIRKQYTEIVNRAASTSAAQDLRQINSAIADARSYIKGVQESLNDVIENLDMMEKLGRKDTDEYRNALKIANEYADDIERTQKLISEMEEERKALQAKQPVKRKKGTVSFDGGNVDGVERKGVDRSKLTRQQKNAVAMVEALADVVNLDYVFYDGDPKGDQGAYVGGGTIFLNINSGMAINKSIAAATLSHELTHWMKVYAPEEYDQLRQYVMDSLLEKGEFEKLVDKQLDLEPYLTYDQAVDEVVANACQTMLRDSKAIEKLARENMTLAEKIADGIESIVAKIKAAFEEVDFSDNAGIYRAVRAMQDQFEALQELWDNALIEATRNYNAISATNENAVTEGDVQYMAWGDKEGVANERLEPIDGELRESLLSSGNNIIVDSHDKVVQIVDDAFNNPEKNANTFYGILTPEVLKEIQSKATNVRRDLQGSLFKPDKGYLITANYANIRHLNQEGKLSRSEIIELLDRMADIIIDSDTVKYSDYTAEKQKVPGLRFEKTFEDGTYAAYELVSGRRRHLGMQTMYIEGRDSTIKTEALHHPAGVRASSFTSETEGAQASAESIAESSAPVKQEISSAATSINANKLPALFNNKSAVFQSGGTNIDIGGGRFDNVTEYLAGKGVKNYIFDPYNRPETTNATTLQFLQDGNKADTATCANVLNVIREQEARDNVILEAAKAIKPDGKAYFIVYEGDGEGTGRATKSGWQENRKTATYIPELKKYFGEVTPKGKLLIAERPKKNLPKAAWEISPGKAVQYQRWDDAEVEQAGVSVDIKSESAYPRTQFSLWTWEGSEYNQQRDEAAAALSNALGVSKAKALQYIDSINGVAKAIADDRTRLDYEASEGVSALVGNTEYGGSIDFSTICKKRRLLTGTFTAIQKALPNTALTAEEVLTIRKMMDEKGDEVSCGLCYVEGSRAKMGLYAKQFLDQYAKTNPEYLPNMAEINTPEGIEQIRLQHPDIYAAYLKFMNSLAQRKPKLYQMATEYQGEILRKFRGKQEQVDKYNENGGLRLQSFSDFEIIHLIDNMQVIMDMARVGLNGQAYTKVPEFAWSMGKTGLKINMSLIAKGVDQNGKIVLDEKEGMKRADAQALRGAYPETVGTIIVVFNNEQLKAAMADDFIDFIIPFHRSQWNSQQYELMGLPKGAKDYTMLQNESYIVPVLDDKGKKKRPENYKPNSYWDFSKTGKENAEAYLRMCAENNRVPKFSHVLVNNGDGSYSLQPDGSTDGYWKTLIDFKMYDNDGNGVPQRPVRPIFNEGSENDPRTVLGMLKAYKGGHQSFPVDQEVVDRFVSEYKESHPGVKYQRWDPDQIGIDEWMNNGTAAPRGAGPEVTARINAAAELEGRVKDFFADIPEDDAHYMSPDEIAEAMEINPYTVTPDGDMADAERIIMNLSEISKEYRGSARTAVYELMDELLDHVSGVQQQKWISEHFSQNKSFTKWYDRKHPSLYYKGYQPGKLDKPKEKQHLQDLIENENTPEDLRKEAQIMLDAMSSGANTTWYQRWDDSDEDTKNEREGRTVAYTRIQGENRTLKETIDGLNAAIGKQNTTIEKLQNSLKLGKNQQVRESDARKMADGLLKKFDSTADKEAVAQEIKALGDYIVQNKKLNEDDMKRQARVIAARVLNEATAEVDADEDVPAVRELLGKFPKKLSISDTSLGELDTEGGYNEFRKKNIGNFILTKRVNDKNVPGYRSLDSVYGNLQAANSNYLPPVNSEGEMAIILANLYERAKPVTVNPHEEYLGEAIEETANQILEDMLGGILKPTTGEAEARRMARDLGKAIEAGTKEADTLTKAAKELAYALESSEGSVRAMQKYIKTLQDTQDEAANKELDMLRETVYDLTIELDKAGSRYRTLQESAEIRMAQIRAEGKARAEEARAKQKEREYAKIENLRNYYRSMAANAKQRREENAGVTKYRRQVIDKAQKLSEWLLKNSDKEHVPEALKAPLLEFLTSIDYTSKRALAGGAETRADRMFGARLQKLQQMLSRQQSYINGDGDVAPDLGGYIDVSPDMLSYLRDMAQAVTDAMNTGTDYTINKMDAAQLKDLSNLLSMLTAGIRNMNRLMANARYSTVREAASQDITYMDSLGKAPDKAGSKISRFLQWQDATPYYAMKRFGQGGQAIFDGLTRGWETLAKHAKEIIGFTEQAYTDQEVNEWKKQIHDITLEDGHRIRMTTAQIMELSMLLRREQAQKHLKAGGMRIGNIEKKRGTISDTAHYHLTSEDVRGILSELTPRQMEVASALQQFMAVRGAEWGNEISMKRFGYDFYTEGENYYPIKTDANDRPMRDTDAIENSMFRLLNLSSSKSLNPKASNALVVNDIFDTFADHMTDQAKLNALGLPILDAIKWFNYKEKIDNGDGTYNTRTLQAAMERAYQSEAQKYFRTLMKDVNGVTESGDRGTDVAGKLISNYKVAAVGANLRVALLQPTAYVRAMTLLSPRNLMRAFAYKNGIEEALRYSGTALWKSLGYYDTNISRNMRQQIQHNETWKDKVQEVSMAGAELGDKRTWGRLWVACKLQVEQMHPDLTGDKLMYATADLFRGVVYSSQVMDSTLTRSELMRGRTLQSKALTAFMAEPTLSYNVLLDAYSEYQRDVRRNGKQGAWKRNQTKLARAFTVYVASATVSAIAESFVDAARDDDDYETYWQKFLQAMFGEENPFEGNWVQDLLITGKIPYAKNILSALTGFGGSSDMSTEAISTIIQAAQIWKETIDLETGALEKPTKTTYYGNMQPWGKIYKTLQGLSQLAGLPASAAARDVIAIWNTTAGNIVPSWKIKTYDAGEKSNIKQAYSEGRMTFGEAVDKLIASGASGSREDAEKELAKAGSKLTPDMDNLLNSIRRGKSESAEKIRQNMIEHGTPLSYIAGNVQNDVKEQYMAGNISYEQAMADLTNYGGVNTADAGNLLKWWAFSDENFAAINTSGNKEIEQAELGNYLLQQIKDKKMTNAEADAIWKGRNIGATTPWKDSFAKWSTSASYNSLKKAALEGNAAEYNSTLQTLMNSGVKEKDAKARVKTFVRNVYFGDDLTDAETEIVGTKTLSDSQAQSMLVRYAGMDATDAQNTVAEWRETRQFSQAHGSEYEKYDLTVQQAKYWYDNGLSSTVSLPTYASQVESYGMDRVKAYYGADGWIQTGLTMDQYDTYATGRSQCKGTDRDGDGKTDSGSVKVQALQVINALPVSNAVKDAIYIKNGWSERTIYEAPWH